MKEGTTRIFQGFEDPAELYDSYCHELQQLFELVHHKQTSLRMVLADGQKGWLIASSGDQWEYMNDDNKTCFTRAYANATNGSVDSPEFSDGKWRVHLLTKTGSPAGYLEVDWLVIGQFVGREQLAERINGQFVNGLKPLTTQATRFKHFIENIRLLAKTCEENTFENAIHIGWGTHKLLFKYLEHAKRKLRRNEIGAFEVFLLDSMPCTVGGGKPPAFLHAWLSQ